MTIEDARPRSKQWNATDVAKWRKRFKPLLPLPCVRCGRPVMPEQEWDVDHIIAVTEGGGKTAENLGPSHRTCNRSHGGKLGAAKTNAKRAIGNGLIKFAAPGVNITSPTNELEEINKSFEGASKPPPVGNAAFFHNGPQPVEHVGVRPLHVSTFEGFEGGREEFLTGARLLGLDTARKPIQPQQYVIADAINAQKPNGVPLHSVTAISVPRRATKTTSWWAVALGRISNPARGDYQVGFTAQTQVKARERWMKDLVKPLERLYPEPKESPYVINRQPGASFIECKATGGRISILPPSAESFRGEGFDLVGIDEAQEVEPDDESEDLVAGILPTFDTRTIDGESSGQLILMGTAGAYQGGVFWDYLEKGREGKGGIVEYAAHPDTPYWEEGMPVEGTVADPEVWKLAHPGAGGLTPMTVIAERFEKMTPLNFAREYLGMWPTGTKSRFIDSERWAACALPYQPILTHPGNFIVGVSVHMDQTSASIVAAWRVDGVAYGAVLSHAMGTRSFPQKVVEVNRAYGQQTVYDKDTNAVSVEVEKVRQLRIPRLKLVPQNWDNVSTAAALLMKEIQDGNARHFSQPMLDEAVGFAVKRGTPNSKRWAFGRGSAPENDITPLEAWALALRAYDELKPKAALRPSSAA